MIPNFFLPFVSTPSVYARDAEQQLYSKIYGYGAWGAFLGAVLGAGIFFGIYFGLGLSPLAVLFAPLLVLAILGGSWLGRGVGFVLGWRKTKNYIPEDARVAFPYGEALFFTFFGTSRDYALYRALLGPRANSWNDTQLKRIRRIDIILSVTPEQAKLYWPSLGLWHGDPHEPTTLALLNWHVKGTYRYGRASSRYSDQFDRRLSYYNCKNRVPDYLRNDSSYYHDINLTSSEVAVLGEANASFEAHAFKSYFGASLCYMFGQNNENQYNLTTVANGVFKDGLAQLFHSAVAIRNMKHILFMLRELVVRSQRDGRAESVVWDENVVANISAQYSQPYPVVLADLRPDPDIHLEDMYDALFTIQHRLHVPLSTDPEQKLQPKRDAARLKVARKFSELVRDPVKKHLAAPLAKVLAENLELDADLWSSDDFLQNIFAHPERVIHYAQAKISGNDPATQMLLDAFHGGNPDFVFACLADLTGQAKTLENIRAVLAAANTFTNLVSLKEFVSALHTLPAEEKAGENERTMRDRVLGVTDLLVLPRYNSGMACFSQPFVTANMHFVLHCAEAKGASASRTQAFATLLQMLGTHSVTYGQQLLSCETGDAAKYAALTQAITPLHANGLVDAHTLGWIFDAVDTATNTALLEPFVASFVHLKPHHSEFGARLLNLWKAEAKKRAGKAESKEPPCFGLFAAIEFLHTHQAKNQANLELIFAAAEAQKDPGQTAVILAHINPTPSVAELAGLAPTFQRICDQKIEGGSARVVSDDLYKAFMVLKSAHPSRASFANLDVIFEITEKNNSYAEDVAKLLVMLQNGTTVDHRSFPAFGRTEGDDMMNARDALITHCKHGASILTKLTAALRRAGDGYEITSARFGEIVKQASRTDFKCGPTAILAYSTDDPDGGEEEVESVEGAGEGLRVPESAGGEIITLPANQAQLISQVAMRGSHPVYAPSGSVGGGGQSHSLAAAPSPAAAPPS